MASIAIPEQYKRGLIAIRTLESNSFEQLASALSGAPPLLERKQLSAWLASKMPDISKEDIDGITAILISVSATQIRFSLSIPQIVEDVCQSIEQSQDKEIMLSEDDRAKFKDRLTKLLTMESLIYPSKGMNILTDHERTFERARILTDVRAVFGPDPAIPPKAAVIIHMLNITYRQDGDPRDFYVALDTNDIEELMSVLERARSKANGLRYVLKAAEITQLEVE